MHAGGDVRVLVEEECAKTRTKKRVRGLVLYHESDEGDDKITKEREEK